MLTPAVYVDNNNNNNNSGLTTNNEMYVSVKDE